MQTFDLFRKWQNNIATTNDRNGNFDAFFILSAFLPAFYRNSLSARKKHLQKKMIIDAMGLNWLDNSRKQVSEHLSSGFPLFSNPFNLARTQVTNSSFQRNGNANFTERCQSPLYVVTHSASAPSIMLNISRILIVHSTGKK